MKKTRQKATKRLPVNSELMVKVEPLTPNQERIFKAWDEGKHNNVFPDSLSKSLSVAQ